MRITYPDELLTHPVAVELKLRHRGRLYERAQVVEEILCVNVGGDKAFLSQTLGYPMGVALLRDPQNPAHGCWQPVWETRDQPEVHYSEPVVPHELEIPRVGICVQEPDHAWPGK